MPTAVEDLPNRYFAGVTLRVEVQLILSRLSEHFGPDFHLISAKDGWVNFEVWGQLNDAVFEEIDQNSSKLFGWDLDKFQVLYSPTDSSSRGLFLHHLHTPQLREEYRAGVWNY